MAQIEHQAKKLPGYFDVSYILSRVNNLYIEESVLLSNTPLEMRSVKL